MAAVVQTAIETNPQFPSGLSTFGLSQERGTLSLHRAQGGASSPTNSVAQEDRKMSFSVGSFTPTNGIQHGLSYSSSNGQAMQPQPYVSKSQQASIYTVCARGPRTHRPPSKSNYCFCVVFWRLTVYPYRRYTPESLFTRW